MCVCVCARYLLCSKNGDFKSVHSLFLSLLSPTPSPGKPAPKLILKDMIELMKPGSVVVDLAAEAGGNCELCVPGQINTHNGVTIIGYTDFPSRLPSQSSSLYSNNIRQFIQSMEGEKGHWKVDLNDVVVRNSMVTHDGALTYPPPPLPPPSPSEGKAKAGSAIVKKVEKHTLMDSVKQSLGMKKGRIWEWGFVFVLK